jgi:hypothetical protein
MCPADTSAQAWRVFPEALRRMSASQKLQRVSDLSAVVQSAAEDGLRQS